LESQEIEFEINAEDCQEVFENVNVPMNFNPNKNVMKQKDLSQEDKDRNVEVRFIERVVFRERPVKLMIDRAVQSDVVNLRPLKESKNAETQTILRRFSS
jgi:hypothetical protein